MTITVDPEPTRPIYGDVMLPRLRHLTSLSRKTLALALMLSVLVAGWMAVAPELHDEIHHDSHSDHHECLVTLMCAGSVDHALPVPLIIAAPAVMGSAPQPLHAAWVRPLYLDGGVLVHGPPERG